MNRYRMLLAGIGMCLVVTAATAAGQRGDGQQGRAPALAEAANALRGAAANAQTAWWTDTALMTRLGLTDVQKARIESSFQSYRPNLTSAKETLEKEEAQLSRLLDADSVDRSAVQLQVNRVIQARSEMERLNAAMTLDMREQLTRAQWAQLQRPNGGRGGRGGGGPVVLSFETKYAADKPATLEGTVTEFKFQDPHCFIVFDVVGQDGKVTRWTGELGPSTTLARQGWTATTFKPGDRVHVEGSQAHDPSLNAVNIRVVRRLP
jgi:Spy/CpxP family protein refolding chaperone